jgi:sugar/nucleoside kinase (ribokinase family)
VAQCGKPVWTDLHDFDGANTYHQPFIDAAQFIHLSSDNLTDYRAVMERFVSMGKKLVVCTHGKAGATLLSRTEGWIDAEAETVQIVDTNGAGDSFFAGFMYGWLQQLPLHTCMRMGTRAAALCVQSPTIVSEKLSASML